jgi:hypothetical protein
LSIIENTSMIIVLKRFVRNQATRAYMMGDGGWGDFRSAQHFPDVQDALLACHRYGITEAVDMVLVMGQSPSDEFDIALPLFAKIAVKNGA